MLLFKLSPYPPTPTPPLDHFVHMVLFFHCADDDDDEDADDDDEPVLHHRERSRLDVV